MRDVRSLTWTGLEALFLHGHNIESLEISCVPLSVHRPVAIALKMIIYVDLGGVASHMDQERSSGDLCLPCLSQVWSQVAHHARALSSLFSIMGLLVMHRHVEGKFASQWSC